MNGPEECVEQPSHVLWVELSTRISSQRLHFRSGGEEGAVESLHALFTRTRELLEKHPQDGKFQALALPLLNQVLRPELSRWHGWLAAGEEMTEAGPRLRFRDPWVRRQFRRELRALQPRLLGYRKAFEALKDGKNPQPGWTHPDAAQLAALRKECGGTGSTWLGDKLKAGIPDELGFGAMAGGNWREVVANINADERRVIQRKRGEAEDRPLENAAALAFSGGGIRSATFCLGISQVLARRGIFDQFDYLSTVSGGGYFGSFLSTWLGTGDWETRPSGEGADAAALKAETKARLETLFDSEANRPEPRAIRHLRNHSRYLADGSFTRKLAGIGIVALGVIFNLLIILPVPLLAAVVTAMAWKCGWFGGNPEGWMEPGRWLPAATAPASLVLWLCLGVVALMALSFPSLKSLGPGSKEHGRPAWLAGWEKGFVLMTILSGLLLLGWLLPGFFRIYHEVRTAPVWGRLPSISGQLEDLVGALGTLATVIAGVVASKSVGGRAGRLVRKLAILSGPLLYLFIYAFTTYRILFVTSGAWHASWVLLVAVLLLVWAMLGVDVNTYSPHGYYRDRLSECYLQTRKNDSAASKGYRLEPVDRLRLSELNQTAAAPYHLINTTVNLPSSQVREMRGRDADFFLFSKHWCGSPMCGYFRTADLEKMDPHLDLGTAMAISGAAVSSNMGWQTNNALRLLMTVANVRLGYWLRNPKFPIFSEMPAPGPAYLFREMFARGMDEEQPYLNLSDGGHHENLAVYELLRRRCKFIVCVDGGMEPDMQCVDLIRLERYAAIDLGIRMHYDLADLMLQPNGFGRAYGVLVKIDYAPPKDETARGDRQAAGCQWGWMLYIKLAMVGYGPGYVMDYKRTNPAFPHQTTNDQIYDEAQFEAYRALGEAAAESFFSQELFDGRPDDLADWFGKLAAAMLPDNDEAVRLGAEVDQAVAKSQAALAAAAAPPEP